MYQMEETFKFMAGGVSIYLKLEIPIYISNSAYPDQLPRFLIRSPLPFVSILNEFPVVKWMNGTKISKMRKSNQVTAIMFVQYSS